MRSAVLGLCVLLVSCAGRRDFVGPPVPELEDPGVALSNPGGLGRGCPADGVIYTARHVLENRRNPGEFFGALWTDRLGNSGWAKHTGHSSIADVGILIPQDNGPKQIRMAKTAPLPGDTVHWWGYDYRDRARALAGHKRQATIIRHEAGLWVLSELPNPGASGGCLLNDAGDVVGIIVWGIQLHDRSGVGLAVNLMIGRTQGG